MTFIYFSHNLTKKFMLTKSSFDHNCLIAIVCRNAELFKIANWPRFWLIPKTAVIQYFHEISIYDIHTFSFLYAELTQKQKDTYIFFHHLEKLKAFNTYSYSHTDLLYYLFLRRKWIFFGDSFTIFSYLSTLFSQISIQKYQIQICGLKPFE